MCQCFIYVDLAQTDCVSGFKDCGTGKVSSTRILTGFHKQAIILGISIDEHQTLMKDIVDLHKYIWREFKLIGEKKHQPLKERIDPIQIINKKQNIS